MSGERETLDPVDFDIEKVPGAVSAPPPQEGRKYDNGKLRYDLVDPYALAWLVASLTYGTAKYAAWNWVSVEEQKDRYYGALMRHIEKWRSGEDDDTESGLPHLANAMFCVMCLTALNAPRDMDEAQRRANEAIRRWRVIQDTQDRNK